MKSVMVVVSTRPETIKMAPLIGALQKSEIPLSFVHCGQHYDYNMSKQFIEELEITSPDYSYTIKAYSQGIQTAKILANMERLMKKKTPELVLVEGDTNGVLATTLAALKLRISVGHVEAGLRSFDIRMPEEHNRRLTDHASAYLFAPTKVAEKNLIAENVWGKIYVTGNTVIDAVIQHLPKAQEKSRILEQVHFKTFALATAHRAENVDDQATLKNFMETFAEASIPVVYPMHPRTRERLQRNRIFTRVKKSKNIQILPPIGYLDFLVLMKECELIVTDSGGIQEEATAPCIRKPVLVIRLSTERQEAVESGFAEVVGTGRHAILDAIERTLEHRKKLPEKSPYGNGDASRKITEIIKLELAF